MRSRELERQDIDGKSFDVCVIGGGATGAGCALDAQLRGLRTVMLDAGDFAGATSSAATKIIHGGVRYLEEAVKDVDPKQYHVVVRALHERVRMLNNAPHLTRQLQFLLPSFHWLDVAYLDCQVGQQGASRPVERRRRPGDVVFGRPPVCRDRGPGDGLLA